jgi:hypothetical protein
VNMIFWLVVMGSLFRVILCGFFVLIPCVIPLILILNTFFVQ